MYYLTLIIAIGFGVARLIMPVVSQVHREDIFKDLAHLFTGALYGAGFVSFYLWKFRRHDFNWPPRFDLFTGWTLARLRNCLWIAIALTVLEVVAFLAHKG